MICLFVNGEPDLLLNKVRRDTEGNLRFGFVVNGGWDFEILKSEVFAKSGNYIVNRWPLPDYQEMEIPSNVKGDYNEIMEWAKKEYKK